MVLGSDLINIKDKYGEQMMHLCRKEFSTILEEEGKLFELLSKHFAYSKYLYDDIVNNSLEDGFRNYVYSLLEPPGELISMPETSVELLDSVGYTLYHCHTEEEVNSFAKYYSSNERICTFRKNRLSKCHVFFAVKKDVDEIKREDFFNPQRQDRYGTSVISIQFTRGDVNILSIKNRYNHTVMNPDATFSNNLENIVPGLTKSFERDYGLNVSQNDKGDFEIPGYIRAKDGKLYKYNYEINGIYYCPDNIIIDDYEVIRDYQEKEKYIIIDYFIVDLVNKTVSVYDKSINDSFVLGLKNIKKIDIKKTGKGRKLDIIFEDGTSALVEIDKFNRITSYSNRSLLDIEDNFLYYNKYLETIDVSNVLKIGNGFLYSNNLITSLSFPKLLEIKDDFLSLNTSLRDVDVSKVIRVGNNFLKNNQNLVSLFMGKLEKAGNGFISKNKIIKEIYMPNLVCAGNHFLQCNMNLLTAFFPSLVYVGDWFISANKIINEVDFSSLQEVGDNFLASNNSLLQLWMLAIEKVGNNFLFRNRCMLSINVPRLKSVGTRFLYYNNSLIEMYAQSLNCVGDYFLFLNSALRNGVFSSLEQSGRFCLNNNLSFKKRILSC